jgi:hypothetical protein
MRTQDEIKMSVVIVTHDDYHSIRLVMTYLATQTIAEFLEIAIGVPSCDRADVVEADMEPFHSYQVVEVGPVIHRGRAAAKVIRFTTGPIVAIAENHAFPEPDWAEKLIGAYDRGPWAGICPAISVFNPQTQIGCADWLSTYGHWAAYDEALEIARLPHHNVTYRRKLLMRFDQELEELFDPEDALQVRLRAQGHRFLIEPAANIRHVSTSTWGLVAHASLQSGRLFAARRSTDWSSIRKGIYALASPVFPFIQLFQLRANIARIRKKHFPIAALIPSLLCILCFRAVGEAVGYFCGGGDAHIYNSRHELEIELRVSPKEVAALEELFQARLTPS